MSYFASIPRDGVLNTFSRVRRTYGGGRDSYGDATFTEQTIAGFRGAFESSARPGQTIILAGKEVAYDAVVYTSGTMLVSEDDVLLFASSTGTAATQRYHIHGITDVWRAGTIDHKELYVSQEVK